MLGSAQSLELPAPLAESAWRNFGAPKTTSCQLCQLFFFTNLDLWERVLIANVCDRDHVPISEDKEEYGLTLSPGFLAGQERPLRGFVL